MLAGELYDASDAPMPWFVSPRNTSQCTVSIEVCYAFLSALNGVNYGLVSQNILPSNVL